MMTAIDTQLLSEVILQRTRDAVARLEENPFYARLLAGTSTRAEYMAWLVQMHKYVRFTARALRGLVTATRASKDGAGLHAYAVKEAREEAGHDEMILRDLAALWGTNVHEALGKVERAPTSPAAAAWQSQLDTLVARFPEGIVGPALALETIASLHADRIRAAMIEQDPSYAGAVKFLEVHRAEVEEVHGAEGAAQVDALRGARARSAAYYYAGGALALYEGLAWYMHERFSGAPSGDES